MAACGLGQEASVGAGELPRDLLVAVFSLLDSPRDLVGAARVCSAWHAASEACWAQLRQQHFPHADAATIAALRERAARRTRPQGVERDVYRWLAAQWACVRCGQAFTDGGNAPAACAFHPGILFSGGQLNGAGLRFTCCNRRAHHIPNGSRDANGCAAAFHVGGGSAWQRHGAAGVKPRALAPDQGCTLGGTGGSSSAGGTGGASGAAAGSPRHGGGGAGPPRRTYPFMGAPACLPVEWHPHQRPGLLELPSRLLFS